MKYRLLFLITMALSVAGWAQTNRFPQYDEQPQAVTLNLADDTTLLLVGDVGHTLCEGVVFYTFTGTLGGANRMIALTGGSQNASTTNTPPALLCRLLQAYQSANLANIRALYRPQDATTLNQMLAADSVRLPFLSFVSCAPVRYPLVASFLTSSVCVPFTAPSLDTTLALEESEIVVFFFI
jgi:hypothetical protein